jgi:hypothetical protein
VARRLHEGGKPEFPPSARDAPLLGGSVLDMLEEERGADAVASLVTARLARADAVSLLERAFRRPLLEIERDWRARLASAGFGPRARRRRGYLYEVGGDGDDAAA